MNTLSVRSQTVRVDARSKLIRALGRAALAPALLLALSWPAPVHAANLEPAGINLGGTSFFDGFGRNEGGFTYLTYFQYARAREIHGSLLANGDDSQPLPVFKDPAIDVFVWLNQLHYTVPEGLFGDNAHVGINFVLPLILFNTSFGAPTADAPAATKLTDNGFGVGDLTFGPTLQFKPIMSGGRPVFSHRFELDIIAPIGKYDPSIDINQSSNFVSLVPYWAATVAPFPFLEVSARFHYLYNFKNHRPALGRLYGNQVPPPVKSGQAGQAGWVNFAISGGVPAFHAGVNGYYFHQFNLDLWEHLDGTTYPGLMYTDGGKLKIFGIGPGVMWVPAEHDKLFANLYFQLLVENGVQANVLNLRWVHGF